MNIQSYFNGLLTGVVIGVMFAPRSGAETRRRLANQFDEMKNSVNKGYNASKEKISDELADLADEQKTSAEGLAY
jgi:gas vesicle protein